MFELMDHTGETGFIVKAKTKEEIIRDSIDALYQLYFGEDKLQEKKELEKMYEETKNKSNSKILPKIRMKIKSDGIDFTDALITLLNEIVFLFDTKKITPFRLESVKIIEKEEETEIEAEILFEKLKDRKLFPKIYIKAVTYGGAELKKEGDNFIIPIIIDI
jgi:SHS2 domain-containing protein